MKKYHIGYVQGTFDMFHIGHLLLIQRAAKQCEYLLVGVVSDEFNMSNKKRKPCIPYEDRAAIVSAIRDVNEVIKVERGEGVIDTWKKHPYDCYFSGDDHLGADYIEKMKKNGIDVVLFPYTKRVSSTKLRNHMGKGQGGAYQRPREILFLPYKAAMWDSMESVWQAASKDERCNAVVMPIPYGELDRDRNVREWKWDGDKFPANVPIVDWHDYNIKDHHPDVIYIHNPYDDGNRITMVEPRFFSRNLRQYTEMLVYIPYFAWTGFWPSNHLGLPSYEYVDKIIVQSSQYYACGKDGVYEADKKSLVEMMPPGKVVALGSPKLDRMHYFIQNKVVPESWEKKIGNHKTIFLNATVAPLMTYGRRWLDKLWQTYHTIVKQKDVTVIFRPHPLIMTMMRSKYPEFINEYIKWQHAMEDLPQVIMDKNEDLEMTVAIADAYMGETSSVAQLFALQGKPIFYHDMLLGEADSGEERNLAASAMLVIKDVIYFWAEYWNALCAYHTERDEVEILYEDRPSVWTCFNYSSMVEIEGHLVLVPNCSLYILDYDLHTGETAKIPYDNPLTKYNFGHALVYDGQVLMFGVRQPVIIAYDVKDQKIEYRFPIPNDILKNRTDVHDQLLGKPCCFSGDIYIPIVNSNQVMQWNPDSNEYFIHTVGDKDATYGFACEHAGNIWLAPWLGGPLTVWHPPTGIVQNFDQFPRGFEFVNMLGVSDTFFFVDTIKCGHYWYLLPYCANMILRMDFNTGNIEKVDLGFSLTDAHAKFYQQQQNIWCGAVNADKVMVWAGADRNIYCLHGETMTVEESYQVRIEKKMADKHVHSLDMEDFCENPVSGQVSAIYEDGVSCTQNAFFEYVKHGKHDYESQRQAFAKLTVNADGTCGQKIHQYIMEESISK